jgi:hypothetical protein
MHLGGTKEQQLIFLNTHWGSRYTFTPPDTPAGKWTAVASFGQRDKLQEESATDLLHALRQHYTANRPGIE